MTAILLALLSLFGGVAWAFHPGWYALFGSLLFGLLVWLYVERPVIAWRDYLPILPLAAAVLISAMANPGDYAPRLLFWAWALIGPLDVRTGMPQAAVPAGLVWLFAWPFAEAATGLNLSSNIQASWGYLFALAALAGRAPGLAIAFASVPLALGSRGGLIGLAVGLLVYFWPRLPAWLRLRWPWLIPLCLAAFPLLWGLRPSTANVRVDYAVQAISAWAGHWWLGIGPGQLSAAELITDPRYGYQVHHAHNLYLDVAAETGLLGLAALGLSAWLYLCQPRPRWALASLAALAAHGLVDDPVYLPGLMVYAVALGMIGRKEEK
jgi:hypothetical protein